ncbi:hypothetical protein [Streptomyces flavofungini]|uniref:Lipoprotein n=1 Tax=Streptomyces flavofungini TaxID=68200 RepID=A0ABS0X870_9ACTN|nr:hypothetical protein [Streptomyces flavofungini]MBJ3809402.1 hypothetical protein [Streptomyces flavofungini]GHC78065.1 hypothetical protein GCM10010349_59150 [Streptomyces flavofungini]
MAAGVVAALIGVAGMIVAALITVSGDGGGDKSGPSTIVQTNEHGDNVLCIGDGQVCVGSTDKATPKSSASPPAPEKSPPPTSPAPEDPPADRPRMPSPTDDDGDGGTEPRPDSAAVASLLSRAPRVALRGPGPGALRAALLDVPSPAPRWSTLGIGALRLRAAGVDGVLFRLPTPVSAGVSVETSQAPADVEYVFFDTDGWRLGTQTAASCATLCPSLTQNQVTAPQYQHVLVTDAGRSAGWPPGQRYVYTPG